MEMVQIPLVVLDTDLRVSSANRSFYEIFQVAEAETIHTVLFELGNGQWDIPQLRSLLASILAHDQPIQDFEVNHDFEQIGPTTMLLNACKLQREDNTNMILLSIEDITERKQFETELIAQERAARQRAEAANRIKDEFLSNLSHELRNPLTSLLAWVQLLRNRILDDAETERALEAIEQSAQAQNHLIEDILDVSRITSGKLRLNLRSIDLGGVVQAALDSIQFTAVEKNIQLGSSLRSIAVQGDSDRLQQVLGNLLSNAIKFTPAGGRVEIALSQVDNQAQIQVSDTGKGIPADLLPHIFERFYQSDSSTTKTNQGLGLGLAIVRHLIDLHGGTVHAESPGEGQGTTLTVRLPLYVPPPTSLPIVEPTVETSLAASQNPRALEGLQILAVDDQVDVLLALQFMLGSHGAEVLTVTTARAALAALSESPGCFDMLISDIGLPEEDGFFLIQQVRSLSAEAGGQIPAIALTGYTSEAEQQRAIEAGFQMHLAKPFDLVRLVAIVADLAKQA
ncbi:MAG: ATP-binding protein [Thermosynechococcaceae cyanobacterium]